MGNITEEHLHPMSAITKSRNVTSKPVFPSQADNVKQVYRKTAENIHIQVCFSVMGRWIWRIWQLLLCCSLVPIILSGLKWGSSAKHASVLSSWLLLQDTSVMLLGFYFALFLFSMFFLPLHFYLVHTIHIHFCFLIFVC